jgi:PAS domain S-box-containing protein
MAISDRLTFDDFEIRVQERTAELGKANQVFHTEIIECKSAENELIKLKDKLEAEMTCRYNRILEGISKIFSIALQAKTEEDLGYECLSVALKVTGSRIGFVSLIGDDGLLHDVAIKDIVWESCVMYDKIGHRRPPENFIVHGIYGHVVNSGKSFFTNDLPLHPYIIGLPYFYPPLQSFLGVPLSLDGKIKGLLAVANREGGYNYEQQKDLEAIAPVILEALQRQRSEDDLREAYENLQVKSEELNVQSEELHMQNAELETRSEKLHAADETLRESERRFRTMANAIPQLAWIADPDGYISWYNERWYSYTGTTPEQMEGWGWQSVHDPEVLLKVLEQWKASLATGQMFDMEYPLRGADGIFRPFLTRVLPLKDAAGNVLQWFGTNTDITDRKRAEEKLQTLANVVESSSDAILTLSLDGIITTWNKSAEWIYGYLAEEVLGKNVSILEPDNLKGETKKLIEEVKPGENTQHYVASRLRKDDELIHVSIALSPVFDASEKLVAISAVTRDITQQIDAERSLLKAEIIRKQELHHRIKNNLQVISSLLDLQADKFKNREFIKNSEFLEAFRESRDRVISMALIHEELYKRKQFETLDLSAYIRKLVEKLFQTYRLDDKNIHLHMDLEENVLLNMDDAVPWGIIVTELVSNSIKHAFLGRNEGRIYINLHREKNGERISNREDGKYEGCKSTGFILKVADDGIGIPESIDLENCNSLGIQLVTTLIDQLDGELELKRNKGLEFTIKFTVTKK